MPVTAPGPPGEGLENNVPDHRPGPLIRQLMGTWHSRKLSDSGCIPRSSGTV